MTSYPEKLMPPEDLKQCAFCGRSFRSERIDKHEAICQESSANRRKSFDAAQQRHRGTEIERLTRGASTDECLVALRESGPCGLSTNWREKHEDFLQRIKKAKEYANGKNSKVNELPFPPPVDENADYVQCQYCLRLFNQKSALRHIAICSKRMPESKSNLTTE